jgi:hypothetical protein
MNSNYKERLKYYVDGLLIENASWHTKRENLNAIADLFAEMHVYDLKNQNDNPAEKEIWLDTGYAVSSWSAAMCLLEVARTTVFLKGIIEAIRVMLARNTTRPLHILDAGCGPYALLSIIPALYFSFEEVQFHLIDIIPENIRSVQKAIMGLELQAYIGGIYEEDASKFIWPATVPLHIAISETMLNALRKEPQVAITLNLCKQLVPDGIFIPEQINVELMQVDQRKKHRVTMSGYDHILRTDFETKLADIMQLNKNTIANDENSIPLTQVQLRNSYNPTIHGLELYTTIKVFGDQILQHNDCSLTLPYILSRPFKQPIPSNAVLDFSYQILGNPGIKMNISS